MSKAVPLDFNDAPKQTTGDPPLENAKEIKARLLTCLPSALHYLFPQGKQRGKQFVVGDLAGHAGKSLVVETEGDRAGMWIDFATGEGGDIFQLWAGVINRDAQRDFPQVIASIVQWLGNPTNNTHVGATCCAQPPALPAKTPPTDELGPVTSKWDYLDKSGQLIACVYRYDTPEGKVFRPWDVQQRKMQAPNPRPLYNQPQIVQADRVVLVEGEKCADALIAQGIVATTAMNGANAPVDKTDWSPLQNKQVVIWPDNDAAGKAYAAKAADAIKQAGAHSVSIISIPDHKPSKWDAADAVAEGEDVDMYIATPWTSSTASKDSATTPAIVLEEWLACKRFVGDPSPRQWLIQGVFPMAQVSLLAASGGVGKSFLLAQLAREVAAFNGFRATSPTLFGGELQRKGAAVYFTAEDDCIEMHIRLKSLGDIPDTLYVVPLPDAGGARPLFSPDPNRRVPVTTAFWVSITEQLKLIADLQLIIFDPLQPLCALDFNVPENAQFVCSHLAVLAAESGASVIVSHHFAKREATTPEQAREAIRGSGGLVDGVRCAYALWLPSADRAQDICKSLSHKLARNAVVMGGVVKANGRANLNVTVFVRDDISGILVDRTDDLAQQRPGQHHLFSLFIEAIAQAARDGKPYTKTGLNGVYERRFELPDGLNQLGKHRLVGVVEQLQSDGKLITAMAPGQTSVKWLDVPDGPVARGEAEFVPGHIRSVVGTRK